MARSTLVRRVALAAAALAGWLLVAGRLIRPLLESLAAGGRLPGGDDVLRAAAPLTWSIAFAIVVIAAFPPAASLMAGRAFFERCVGRATPGALGAIRAWVAAILLASTLWEDLPSCALLPHGMWQPKGILHLLAVLPIGLDRLASSATALAVLQTSTAVALGLAMIGAATRLTVPLGTIGYFLVAGILRSYSWFYHTGLIPLYVLALLSFLPCGDGFSIDRRLRAARGLSVPDADLATARYGWARYAVWVVIALPYVEAASSKLYYTGLGWVSAATMKKIVLTTSLAMMHFDFDLAPRLVAAPDGLFWMLAAVGLYSELLFGLVLVSRVARAILPIILIAVHVGIWLLQNILFFDLILILVVFYDFRALRRLRPRVAVESDEPPAVHENGARLSLVLAGFLAFWWLTHIEFYPLTTMKMFSQVGEIDGRVRYVLAFAAHPDGRRERAPLESAIPAMADSRYRRVLGGAFTDGGRARCGEFLGAVAREWNRHAAPADRIVRIDVELWEWNYAAEPASPARGTLLEANCFDASGAAVACGPATAKT